MINENIKKNFLPAAIVIAGLLVAGAVYITTKDKAGKEIPGFLSSQQAADKAINYINTTLLTSGTAASLLNVSDQNGIYKIQLKIGDQEFPSYVTKDGKLLFPQEGVNLDEKISAPEESSGTIDPSEKEYSKEKLETLAKCLNEKGAKFYGTATCPWCTKQKEMFGQAAKYLPYVDCQEKRAECETAKVGGVPDWRFPDGSQQVGMLPIEELVKLSGCEF